MTSEESSYLAFTTTLAQYASDLDREGVASWKYINFNNYEPDIVKAYLLDQGVGIDHLNKKFAKPFTQRNKRFSMKFCSVFIHGRPMVYRKPVAIASCELGDLCTIFVFVDKHKNVRHARATIAQAKMGGSLVLTSIDQRELYDQALSFDYAWKAFYTQTFNKLPYRELPSYSKSRALGMKYLLLKPSKRAVLYSPPSIGNRHHGWGSSLYRMASGSDGLPFIPGKPAHDQWSAILDDLIKMGQGAIKSSSKKSKPRANPSELDTIIDEFNHFENYEKWSLASEENSPGGVSIMLMIVQDKELEAAEPIKEN